MSIEDKPPADGRARVDLATQVAHVAAQVSAALRSAGPEKRIELEARLALAQERLEGQGAPSGLIPFLQVMRGLLRSEDVSAEAGGLSKGYRAVYEQLVGELREEEKEGTLTVREVMDEVAHNVILAMVRGTFDQRRRMADTLQVMEEESRKRPDLDDLRDLLEAARILLGGGDPSSVAEGLRGPFREKWEEILKAIDV